MGRGNRLVRGLSWSCSRPRGSGGCHRGRPAPPLSLKPSLVPSRGLTCVVIARTFVGATCFCSPSPPPTSFVPLFRRHVCSHRHPVLPHPRSSRSHPLHARRPGVLLLLRVPLLELTAPLQHRLHGGRRLGLIQGELQGLLAVPVQPAAPRDGRNDRPRAARCHPPLLCHGRRSVPPLPPTSFLR